MSIPNVSHSRVTFASDKSVFAFVPSEPVVSSEAVVSKNVSKNIFSYIKISDTQVRIAIVAAVAFLALAGLLAATALTGGLAAVPLALIAATAAAGIINVPLITIVFVNAFYDRKDESAQHTVSRRQHTVSRDQSTRKREPSPQFMSKIEKLIVKGETNAADIRKEKAAEAAADADLLSRVTIIEGNPADAPHRLF